MKHIILLGDSIRISYESFVRETLADDAMIYAPDENCKFAQYLLRHAHDWKHKNQWPTDADLVHWNAGLWDVLELYEDGPLTTLTHYEELISRIDRRLRRLFPHAKMVFATSTAVLDDGFSQNCKRSNAVIEQYNAAALRALSQTDTVINDLYALTRTCPPSYYTDATHPRTPEAIPVVGGQVVEVIRRELGL